MDDPAGTTFKRVYADFPNIALPTKSTTPGNIQDSFGRVFVWNRSLGETSTDFSLAGSLEYPKVVSIYSERAFASTCKKIRLPAIEVLLCATTGNLTRSKKLKEWVFQNSILFPPLLAEAVVLDFNTSDTELLKIFSAKIADHRSKPAVKTTYREDEEEDKLG